MPIDTKSLPPEIIAALDRGDLIAVVRFLRETKGLDLRAAKAAVDQYLKEPGGTLPEMEPGAAASGASAEVVALIQQGRKIDAIKLLRHQTGMDLKAAKEAVETITPSVSASRGGLAPGEVARKGIPFWLIAVVLLLAWLGYTFLSRSGS